MYPHKPSILSVCRKRSDQRRSKLDVTEQICLAKALVKWIFSKIEYKFQPKLKLLKAPFSQF